MAKENEQRGFVEYNEITFSDLSWPLKLAVVGSYIMIVLNLIAFMVGYISGVYNQ